MANVHGAATSLVNCLMCMTNSVHVPCDKCEEFCESRQLNSVQVDKLAMQYGSVRELGFRLQLISKTF